jgi:peroxiredoxin family protein
MSRLNFAGASPVLMTGLMKSRNVATLPELFEASIALGANIYACEMAMVVLGLSQDDLIPEVKKVLGVASFLEMSKGGQTLFI